MRVMTTIKPSEVREGDEIVNVGVVTAFRQDGVFTVVEVSAMVWSTVTGRGREATATATFHASEEIVVGRHVTEGTLPTPTRVITTGSLT